MCSDLARLVCNDGAFAQFYFNYFMVRFIGIHLEAPQNHYGMVWYGTVWYGMVWYGMVWYGMVWYGMVWYGLDWEGTGRNGRVGYGTDAVVSV